MVVTKQGLAADETALAYTVPAAVEAGNGAVSRSALYIAMREGRLKAKKLGKRTIILREDLAAFLASLPEYPVAA